MCDLDGHGESRGYVELRNVVNLGGVLVVEVW